MRCTHCGMEASGRFCSNCGALLPIEQLKSGNDSSIIRIDDYLDDEDFSFLTEEESSDDATRVFSFSDNFIQNTISEREKKEEDDWINVSIPEESPVYPTMDLPRGKEKIDQNQEEPSVEKISPVREGEQDFEEKELVFSYYQKQGVIQKLKDKVEWEDDAPQEEWIDTNSPWKREKRQPSGKTKKEFEEEDEQDKRTAGEKIKGVLSFLLQRISFLMMLWIWWRMMVDFWSSRTSLGYLTEMIADENLPLMVYSAMGLLAVAVAALASFWILSKKRVPGIERKGRYDAGRGLTVFLIFALLSLLSGPITSILPETPKWLYGFREGLAVLDNFSVCRTAIIGVILCLIRKAVKW